jgi:hypothetical protein
MKLLKKSIAFFLLSILLVSIVHAQTEELNLSFSRDWGYANGSGSIQGFFSMIASSTIPLTKVNFFIDSVVIGTVNKEPFKIQFNTDDYSPGLHTLHAIGFSSDGRELNSKVVKREFVTAEASNKAMYAILVPVLGLVLLIVILSTVIPALTSRKKGPVPAGYIRNYGAAGGTICPKCKRPFARHILAPNMLLGKLERCPHCGKWGIARPLSIDLLHEAEKAELNDLVEYGGASGKNSEKNNLYNEIDDTKYQGL